MTTGTVPRLEQLDFFYGFCLVGKSLLKPKLHRALTSEKRCPGQAPALNRSGIITLTQGRPMNMIASCESFYWISYSSFGSFGSGGLTSLSEEQSASSGLQSK